MTPPSISPKHNELQLNQQGPLPQLLAHCDALVVHDKASEAQAAKYNKIGCWSGIAAFFVGIITLFILPISLSFVPVLHSTTAWIGLGVVAFFFIALVVGLVVVAIVAGQKAREHSQGDIEDRKIQLPQYLLRVLGPEIDQRRPVQLWVDFRAHDMAPGYGWVLAQQDISGYDRWTKATFTRTLYRHPFFGIAFRLSDGTGVQLEGTTTAKRKTLEGWRRSLRGKTKQKRKRKEKASEQLVVKLSCPKGHAFPADLEARLLQIAPPPEMWLKSCKVKGKQITFSYQGKPLLRNSRGMVMAIGGGQLEWEGVGAEHLLTGPSVLNALAVSYKALALMTRPATAQ